MKEKNLTYDDVITLMRYFKSSGYDPSQSIEISARYMLKMFLKNNYKSTDVEVYFNNLIDFYRKEIKQ